MKVKRVTDLAAFRDLAPVWSEVTSQSGQTSPFSSHDWIECCWNACDPAHRPETLLVEDTAGPVALIPMVAWAGRLRGLPVRYLGMLDSPDTAFADWIVLGRPDPVVRAVLDHLDARGDWDAMLLAGLPSSSDILKSLTAALPERLRWQRVGVARCPYVDVSGTWESFWASTSQRFKKTVRNVKNRLEKAGRVEVEEHREVSRDSAVFGDLLEVSRRSWKGPRQLAIATMPRMAEFFADLSERASRHGWLRLWLLRLDGRAVASEYQLEADGRVHALRGDFDDSVPDELSPGTYLSAEILRVLFARDGVHDYDMGPGDNPYKARWATGARETFSLRAFRSGAYGAALHALESHVVPVLRRLRRGDRRS